MMTTNLQIRTIDNPVAVVDNGNPFSNVTIENWIEYCDVQPTTQKTYNKAIQSFASYLESNGIEHPARQDVINYREWLLASGYKVSSVRLYMTIVKKFFSWLASKGLYLNVADGVKLPAMMSNEHAHDALTLSESRQAISFFEGKKDVKSIRDRCILSLMICSGLRSIEVTRLDIGDIEKRKGIWFIKVHGKGRAGKVDSVQISETVKSMIDEYLSVRPKGKKGTALFVSTANRNFGQRLQTQSISRLSKKVFAEIGIVSERITCHSCRATAVTLMLQAGVSLREVQKVMRHRSAATTEIYANDIDLFNNRGVATLSNLLFAA